MGEQSIKRIYAGVFNQLLLRKYEHIYKIAWWSIYLKGLSVEPIKPFHSTKMAFWTFSLTLTLPPKALWPPPWYKYGQIFCLPAGCIVLIINGRAEHQKDLRMCLINYFNPTVNIYTKLLDGPSKGPVRWTNKNFLLQKRAFWGISLTLTLPPKALWPPPWYKYG